MKRIDELVSLYHSELYGPASDARVEETFKAKVFAILKCALLGRLELLVARVESLWQVSYAGLLHRLDERKESLASSIKRDSEKAARIQEGLDNGIIPQFEKGETIFLPPRGFWMQFAFYGLGGIALIASVFEWINFGWYLRFTTDSFPLGLAFAFTVLIIPPAKAALLISLRVGERGRRIAAIIQGCAAMASAVGYVYLSLVRSDSSLASVLADTKGGFSVDSWRMLFQLIASVTIAALCMDAAFSLGGLKRTPSLEYIEATAKIDSHNRQVNSSQTELADVEGEIDKAHAVKEDTILFCKHKHEQMQAIREELRQQQNEIENERP